MWWILRGRRVLPEIDTISGRFPDTVLGVCSYVDGGLIVTTIDVESVSERADSATFPLLGNMLDYHVSPYPQGSVH